MSLSPDVAPFVPKQVSSAPANAPRSSSRSLSADVAEFVPSWLSGKTASLQDHNSNDKTTSKPRSLKIGATASNEKIVVNNDSSFVHSKSKPSLKASGNTNANKKKASDAFMPTTCQPKTKEKACDENTIESDFPALGNSLEESKSAPTFWAKPVSFGVSFSDKLKSSSTSSYFYKEPPTSSKGNDKSRQEQHTSVKSKECVKDEVRVENMGIKRTNNNNINRQSGKITRSQSDDEGFSLVQRSSGRDKRHAAWGDDNSERGTNEEKEVVKRFSEKRSTSSRERRGPERDPRGVGPQKDRGSTSENWRSGRRFPGNEKVALGESRKDFGKNSRDKDTTRTKSKQTSSHAKDYYTLKSTHGNPESKHVDMNKKRHRENERNNNDETMDEWVSPGRDPVPVKPSAGNRPLLSYSDILKSEPKLQLPDPENVDGKERGILRIPSEASGEDEVEEGGVETGEGTSKKKKKKKKKKKSTTEAQPQPVKKSKELLTLDFGDVFAKFAESSTTKKKPVLRTGGFLPAQAPLPVKERRSTRKTEVQASNVLDSTAPIVFRHKEREVPKKRKPSAMRKILTKEREEKKMAREGQQPAEQSSDEEKSDKETSGEEELDSDDDIDSAVVKKSIHSRRFREYCYQELDYEINNVVIILLKELMRFQDRLFRKDPVKAKAKRRFVCGLREVFKHAKLKKLKCVIVTPNLEPTKSKGGLDDLLSNIIELCHVQNVPVIFSLPRQVLGKILLKKVPVSVVGIFYYDGAQDYFKRLMTLTEVARNTYRDKFNKAREEFLLQKQMEKDSTSNDAGLQATQTQKDEAETATDDAGMAVEASIETIPSDEENFADQKNGECLTRNEDTSDVGDIDVSPADEARELSPLTAQDSVVGE